MDVAGGLSLVQTILQVMDSAVWKEIQSVLGVKSQLLKLKKTMSTIDAILRDAEEQERLDHGCSSYSERDRLERLKEALYQADDLFDEVTTLAGRKKLMPGNNLSKEVSLFFSRFNQLRSAFIWSREIKSIREELDDVVNDHQLAGGFRHSARVRNNPRETHSYVNLENDVIIGRDDDKRVLIDTLLDTTVEENVSVVSIVGIGGLGKTTLAQHIYNDEIIVEKFPQKLWVCVSEDFNVKVIVGQILAAVNSKIKQDKLNLDQLQMKLRQEMDGKKYFLVLDDVWNEEPSKWHELRKVLIGGERVSRILVTTRSKNVADVIESRWAHELEGLSDDESLDLFLKMALKPEEHPVKKELVDIGKEIVQKCANVPLAIRVVGSLLRGQDESKWENLKNTDLANIVQDESNGIIPVMKISYNYLPFHLKSCFSYCAVFSKDYNIIKEDLICLWMAQGFIISSDGESFEDVGEEYFKQLLQRCFFQDVERAEDTEEIVSCKMHDLIHDLAKEVAGTDILSCTYRPTCFNEKTRHVFMDESTPRDLVGKLTNMQRMRTFLRRDQDPFFPSNPFVGSVSKVKYLRVLRLNYCYGLKKLPSGIGELVHLRYLDLSDNRYLRVLPSSITNLYNLQTLKLRNCWELKRLPRELRKLVNLRHLDIYGCSSLTHMPPGMNSMTSLQKLTMFVVRDDDELVFFPFLEKLKLEKMPELKGWWKPSSSESGESDRIPQAPLLSELYVSDCPNLTTLFLGASMNLKSCLPNLAEIKIGDCKRLEHLPLMSQLRHLKVLEFEGLSKVECVESSSSNINSGDEDELVFFPSLEMLKLLSMPKLKGWWKPSSESEESETPQAPKLSHLKILCCPELKTFPLCPGLQELKLYGFNEELGPIMKETSQQKEELREVGIDNVAYLINSLPIRSFHHLRDLCISRDQKMEELKTGEVGEVFRSGRLSSLRSLVIEECYDLKSISGRGVWDHFTALESLSLSFLFELELEDEDDVINNKSTEEESDAEMPWRYLAPTLRSLTLCNLPKMVKLPKGIGCLSSLHSLVIWYCDNLESLTPSIRGLSSLQSLTISGCRKLKRMPEEMRHLTSLTKLHIWECSPELMKECKKKNGANWSNIQHIPNIINRDIF